VRNDRLLITGFGPFLTIGENPSSVLARGSGCRNDVLEVSFKGVDTYIESLDPESFDTWLMLGVAGKAPKFRVELRAQNGIANIPDVLGEVHGPGPINPSGPHQLGTTLWHAPEWYVETDLREPSVDAGEYLCNYLYYRGLEAFPNHRIGFLHVPGMEFVSIDSQASELNRIVNIIRAPG